jgi:gliding motility-associated-like protein
MLIKSNLRPKIILAFLMAMLFSLYCNTAFAQPTFSGYTLSNFINNLARRPASHPTADAGFITNNSQMNKGWANICLVSNPPPPISDTILLTWNQGIFNGAGVDILVVCLNKSFSGKGNIRLKLSDGSYTATQLVNFTTGMINSSGGNISIQYYNCTLLATTTIETGMFIPAAKEIDIASFYNGSLAVVGFEMTNPITPIPDFLTIAMTQHGILDNGNMPVIHDTTITGCNNIFFNGTNYTTSTTLHDTIRNVNGFDSVYNMTHIVVNIIVPVTNTRTISGCNSVVFNGITYSASAILKDTVRSYQGCDSVFNNTHIVVGTATLTTTTTLSGCTSVVFNGNTYSSSTLLKDTTKSSLGCDSIVNITNIIIAPAPLNQQNSMKGCGNVIFNGKIYNSSTLVLDTIKNNGNCDSIYRITTITVSPDDFPIGLGSSVNNVKPGTPVTLSVSSSPDFNIISWQPSSVFLAQNATIQNIVADTTMNVVVKARSAEGCITTARLLLKVSTPGDDIYFPSAFSPASKVGNNTFGPLGYLSLVKNYSLLIYNRYGMCVFFSANPFIKWDGSYKGSYLDQGSYVWQAKFSFRGIEQRTQGTVLLIR